MAEESRKSTRSSRSSGGHSGDGSGAAFAKWMEDDAAEWPDRSGAHQRTAQSFDDELHGVSKEIKHAEGHLKGLKDHHKHLTHHRKRAEEYPKHDDIRNFNAIASKMWAGKPSMDDLHALAFTSHNSEMLETIKNFK
jgi:hypothetical protein